MKLDWLEHFKGIASHYRKPTYSSMPAKLTSFSEASELNAEVRTQRLWKWDLHLGFQQHLPSGASDERIEAARIKAARGIAKMLYGPIIDELREMRIDLLNRGCDYDDPTLLRIESMLESLEVAQP